jgi:hypothetical protein
MVIQVQIILPIATVDPMSLKLFIYLFQGRLGAFPPDEGALRENCYIFMVIFIILKTRARNKKVFKEKKKISQTQSFCKPPLLFHPL